MGKKEEERDRKKGEEKERERDIAELRQDEGRENALERKATMQVAK